MYATTTCTHLDASTTRCVAPVSITYNDWLLVNTSILIVLFVFVWMFVFSLERK